MVICVVLTRVEVLFQSVALFVESWQPAEAPESKLDPLMVMVRVEIPAVAEVGVKLEMTGVSGGGVVVTHCDIMSIQPKMTAKRLSVTVLVTFFIVPLPSTVYQADLPACMCRQSAEAARTRLCKNGNDSFTIIECRSARCVAVDGSPRRRSKPRRNRYRQKR